MMFVRETRQSGLHTTVYTIPFGTASVVLLWLFVGRSFVALHRRWLRLLLRRLIDMAVQKRRALVIVIGVHAVPRRAIFVGRPIQSLARRHVAYGWMRRVRYLFKRKYSDMRRVLWFLYNCDAQGKVQLIICAAAEMCRDVASLRLKPKTTLLNFGLWKGLNI